MPPHLLSRIFFQDVETLIPEPTDSQHQAPRSSFSGPTDKSFSNLSLPQVSRKKSYSRLPEPPAYRVLLD